jgi:cyanophycin synthetase
MYDSRTYTPATVRLVEVRLLDGPNVYRLAPAVKVEVAIGRRRTWYGQRVPERYAVVRLGARARRADQPPPIRRLADWVRRLHVLALDERRVDVGVHRASDPGHWIVQFPWRAAGRAEALANAAYRLLERGEDPRTYRPPRQLLARIRSAETTPPAWVTDEQRHVPLISVSGTNGKSTTTRMIAHILQRAGRRVAMTTTDGVYVDGSLVEEGDLTGPQGARTALEQPAIDVGVFETARGGILLRGLGYESNDAAVLTNISADHLDLQGLHTLPELAEVKSVIAQVTRPTGTVVLNADDRWVAGLARRMHARVVLFSMRAAPPSSRTGRHLARGGWAVVLDDGWLVEARGDRRRRIVRAVDVPTTLGGLARHNIANALAAAAGARAMGATLEQVADGLREFRPTSEQLPGRSNIYRLGNRLVLVDYAHNEAGMAALFELLEALVGRKGHRRASVSLIMGTAGDRPDDTLRAMGRLAGQHADEVSIKVIRRFLRGRTRDSLVGGFLAGLREGGIKPADVRVYDTETEALATELADPARLAGQVGGPPRVMFVMAQDDREGVQRLLLERGARQVDDVAELADLRA